MIITSEKLRELNENPAKHDVLRNPDKCFACNEIVKERPDGIPYRISGQIVCRNCYVGKSVEDSLGAKDG